MKRLVAAIGLIALPATAQRAAADDSLPLGIEVVTGIRSDYVHRGFQLSGSLIDIQAEAEISLSDHLLLNVGAFYGSATGSARFTETAVFFDLRHEADKWTAAFATTWRDYRDSFFSDGFDLSPSLTWHLTDDWDLAATAAYDTGDGGWYGSLDTTWSTPTGADSFFSTTIGTSWTDGYYGSNGWHDVHARVSWTYAINRSVSVTPFLGTSVPARSGPEKGRLFGGLWFEVNF